MHCSPLPQYSEELFSLFLPVEPTLCRVSVQMLWLSFCPGVLPAAGVGAEMGWFLFQPTGEEQPIVLLEFLQNDQLKCHFESFSGKPAVNGAVFR